MDTSVCVSVQCTCIPRLHSYCIFFHIKQPYSTIYCCVFGMGHGLEVDIEAGFSLQNWIGNTQLIINANYEDELRHVYLFLFILF